jgi:hypothetical protein
MAQNVDSNLHNLNRFRPDRVCLRASTLHLEAIAGIVPEGPSAL